MSKRTGRRAGFTLIEMLVVLFIIVILATLVVAIAPRISEQSRAARGADQLQGWLLIAKQRAKNGGRPAGLRLQVPVVTTTTALILGGSTATLTAMSGTQGNGILWSIVGDTVPGNNTGSNLLVSDDDKGSDAEVVHVLSVSGNMITTANPFTHAPHPAGASVRLLGFATTLQYIEQPDDFTVTGWYDPSTQYIRRLIVSGTTAWLEPWPGPPTSPTPPGPPQPAGPDFSSGVTNVNADEWPVQSGDYLELYGGGQVHAIVNIAVYAVPNPTYPNPPYPNQVYWGQLTLASAPANPTSSTGTNQSRIIRSPRVLRGEQDLQMPASVAIDLSTNFLYGNQLPIDQLGNIDILFAPSGSVVGRAQTGPSIILWVRDVSKDQITDGDPTLVATYVRTGFIAAHPIDLFSVQNGGSPYTFTQDGRSSGL
jgi:prepilin-type N-terminal cleavage/methylation domain-containing protein